MWTELDHSWVCARAREREWCLPCAVALVWSPWWTRTCRAHSSACLSSWSIAADRPGARSAGCLCSGTAWSADCPHHPHSDKSCAQTKERVQTCNRVWRTPHIHIRLAQQLQHAQSFAPKLNCSRANHRGSFLQGSKSDMWWELSSLPMLPASGFYISPFTSDKLNRSKNDNTDTTIKVSSLKGLQESYDTKKINK